MTNTQVFIKYSLIQISTDFILRQFRFLIELMIRKMLNDKMIMKKRKKRKDVNAR